MAIDQVLQAKQILDTLIAKQRVHLYKPIQIVEILYRVRKQALTFEQIQHQLESHRNPSKRWRDSVTRLLLDRVSTSSQKYQDNLFEKNAIPPHTLLVLAQANKNGVIERYIYQRFREKQQRILKIGKFLESATPQTFDLETFLAEFVKDKGIKRSIDKAFEIVVYALFNTLVKHLNVIITVSAHPSECSLLHEFEEFTRVVLGIDVEHPTISLPARLYRAGSTNAADRGLDIWANFGPVIQVKHLTLTEELAEDISEGIAADHIVIVCVDGERDVIECICRQLNQRIQGIIVQSQLVQWYHQALHGEEATHLGEDLLHSLRQEFRNEFPFSKTFEPFYKERGYDMIHQPDSPFWVEE
ncbi:HaeII family restriction endonuclease [candidate division KSB3 bacterium]|uniref:HaeII family restriction endonuclease n=1 Tax=candidate division KSB3 bacterium TaxID=2044937 RepID=A0A9D5Q4Z2_9BACT|nr:HaeII family restriction endonuclease [candidate division KSB3 bacterium]MBD3323788.1 HaeII family restriction endonuclease [candidate division KSB3 bacterium]